MFGGLEIVCISELAEAGVCFNQLIEEVVVGLCAREETVASRQAKSDQFRQRSAYVFFDVR